jgi:DNA mismatch endonuclease, patch repair protein
MPPKTSGRCGVPANPVTGVRDDARVASLPTTPAASSAATRKAMQGNRRVDTAPELALRRLLHRAGLRYRVDYPIEIGGRKARPDVVFTRRRLAVFLDGCFWHGCPQHCRLPTSNRDYWIAKIERNRDRDARTSAALEAAGWRVIRAWEHEPPDEVVGRVLGALES